MNYKTKNGIKTAFTVIGVVLLITIVTGLCLQFFGEGNVKPSNWVKKENNSNLVKLESGQVIKGVKFDMTKEPDLSDFEVPLVYMAYPIFDFKEQDGEFEDDPFIAVVDFGVIGKAMDLSLQGKAIILCVDGEPDEIVIYSDNDINVLGESMGFNIKKGWNKKLLNKDGELIFDKRVEVFNLYHSDSWNGVYIGALVSEFCNHKKIENGICTNCEQCFHEYLKFGDKCSKCGFIVSVENLTALTSIDTVVIGASKEDVFHDFEISATLNNGTTQTVKYPGFDVREFYSGEYGTFKASIEYGSNVVYIQYTVTCDDPYNIWPDTSEIHKSLAAGESCKSCGITDFITAINSVEGIPTEIQCSQADLDRGDSYFEELWKNYENSLNITFVDSFGHTGLTFDYVTLNHSFSVKDNDEYSRILTLYLSVDSGEFGNYITLSSELSITLIIEVK